MRVRSGSNAIRPSVCRITKSQVNILTAKKLFYYIDQRVDDNGEKRFFYVLVDNTKGDRKITEFDSMKDMEKAVK